MPGLVEGLIGIRAGETRDITVTFPQRSSVPQLAGKAAVFEAPTTHSPLTHPGAARASHKARAGAAAPVKQQTAPSRLQVSCSKVQRRILPEVGEAPSQERGTRLHEQVPTVPSLTLPQVDDAFAARVKTGTSRCELKLH